MARLSTHVLDTSRGVPAANVAIDLYCGGSHLKSVSTNADGRTEEPLIAAPELIPGRYELIFHAGDYFRDLEVPLAEPPFLDEIVIRFGISDPLANYHVPLLLSPYGYSTYRGS
jgi:5-hydroxyisourate hydrolase